MGFRGDRVLPRIIYAGCGRKTVRPLRRRVCARLTGEVVEIGQSMPYDDGTFDSALSTWTMCTIPDIDLALLEIRRVLRPGGAPGASSSW